MAKDDRRKPKGNRFAHLDSAPTKTKAKAGASWDRAFTKIGALPKKKPSAKR